MYGQRFIVKKGEKHEITNIDIDIDKGKDIDGYVYMYYDIVEDKLDFVNEIGELIDNTIKTQKTEKFKDDILKLINNSEVRDIKMKDTKNDNNKRYIKKDNNKKETKKDNNNNNNNNNKDTKKELIIKTNKKLTKLKSDITNKIKMIDAKMRKLPGDLRLKLFELNNIDVIINDLINDTWYEIYEKKKEAKKRLI